MSEIYTKEEFLILAMLYVANVDGKIQPDEVRVMLERFEPASVAEVDKAHLMDGLRKIVAADDRHLAIEEYILQAVEKMFA